MFLRNFKFWWFFEIETSLMSKLFALVKTLFFVNAISEDVLIEFPTFLWTFCSKQMKEIKSPSTPNAGPWKIHFSLPSINKSFTFLETSFRSNKEAHERRKLFSITIIAAHFSNLSPRQTLWEKGYKWADKCQKTRKTMINDSKVYKQKRMR